jgi:hypothetical protein
MPPSTPDPNSLAAARSVAHTSATQAEYIYSLIRQHQPVAEFELEELSGLDGNSVQPRVWELFKLGRIARVGHKLTPKRRKAYTYGVAETFEPAPPRPIFGKPETGRR